MTKFTLPPSFPYTPLQIYQYLYKIGVLDSADTEQKLPEATLDSLTLILNRHIKTIPFGGLSINYYARHDSPLDPIVNVLDPNSTRGVSVHPHAIFDKLVLQAREGYCFEHSTLLRHVLEFLGFTVFATCARILNPALLNVNQLEYMDITHCVLIVSFEAHQFLVDGGFSHFSTLRPVPIDGSTVEAEGSLAYRIIPDPYIDPTHTHPGPTTPGFRLESKCKGNPWRPVHTFKLTPYLHQDIETLNFAMVHHPSRVFHHHLILDIFIDNGYISIYDDKLTIRVHGDQIQTLPLVTESDRRAAFKKYFGISLPTDYKEHLPTNLELILNQAQP